MEADEEPSSTSPEDERGGNASAAACVSTEGMSKKSLKKLEAKNRRKTLKQSFKRQHRRNTQAKQAEAAAERAANAAKG
eukprot:442632-Pyramimonas_sp.AAC.2